jgi:hypothetical protein
MQTDERTYMTKLTVAFRNFKKAPKRWRYFDERYLDVLDRYQLNENTVKHKRNLI